MAKNKKSSKKTNSNVANNVGPINGINAQKVIVNKNNYNSSINSCEEFYNNVINLDLESMEIEELTEMYDSGNNMLTLFYLLNPNLNSTTRDAISKTQFALSMLIYTINKKNHEQLTKQIQIQKEQIEEQTNQIQKLTQINKDLRNNQRKLQKENKKTNEQMQTMLTTIISIVITISIVSAAVSAIEYMRPLYILPFVCTIVLVGVFFIAFVMSVHKIRLSKESKFILLSIMGIVIAVWLISLLISLCLNNNLVQIILMFIKMI